MTMTGLFIGFLKRKGLADRPGIPIGQPARSNSLFDRLRAWSIHSLFREFGATISDISISIEDDTSTIEFPIQITFNPNHYI